MVTKTVALVVDINVGLDLNRASMKQSVAMALVSGCKSTDPNELLWILSVGVSDASWVTVSNRKCQDDNLLNVIFALTPLSFHTWLESVFRFIMEMSTVLAADV